MKIKKKYLKPFGKHHLSCQLPREREGGERGGKHLWALVGRITLRFGASHRRSNERFACPGRQRSASLTVIRDSKATWVAKTQGHFPEKTASAERFFCVALLIDDIAFPLVSTLNVSASSEIRKSVR